MVSQILDACADHKPPMADEKGLRAERAQRAQWLRAAILGANDGLLSTTSLMLGIGAAKEDRWSMVLSGIAGAIAGACSMAVGEFVSVSTQRDIERANVVSHCRPKTTLCGQVDNGINPDIAANNSTSIAETEIKLTMSPAVLTCEPSEKGVQLSPALTPRQKLALSLSPVRSPMAKVIAEDTLTDMVEEEDNGEDALPNPYKAAAASALAFLCGSFVPLLSAMFVANNIIRIVVVVVVASIALAVFGAMGAYLGGSPIKVSAARVLVGGCFAMAITFGLLKPFDNGSDDKHNCNKYEG
ncbi:hypothetical protein L1049_022671 [Liquidambar formosana]|uniref:Vacuolar iron transporter n=1 Tax=Liquidambar formosana TaxID=63359 RepID=A0AAP0WP18_LIQFO